MNGTATGRSRSPSAANAATLRQLAPELRLPDAEVLPGRARSARGRTGLARQAAYVAIDFALVCATGAGIFWLRFDLANPFAQSVFSPRSHTQQLWSGGYPGFLLLYAGLVVLACMSQDLYRTARERSAWEETANTVKAVGFATALLVLFIFTSGNKEISRLVVACSGVGNAGVLAGWRYAKRRYVLERAKRGEGVSRVLIVGAGKLGRALGAWLEENRHLGYEVCGFLDAHSNGDARVLGSVRDLRKVALGQFADQLFVTLPADREMVKEIFLEARRLRMSLNVVPDLYDGLGWRAPVETIGGFPVIELHGEPIPAMGLAFKRVIDLLGAAALLLLTGPLFVFAAVWIRCDSPGPVFYPAMRVGRKGRKFRCYKLRTMVAEADAQKDKLRQTNERHGPFFKMENDPRVTRCGRWLRKFSIDELPQLVNVLYGQMSLVGPRPHPVDDYERYTIEHLRRLDVKPGVTGLWQVTARRDPSFDTNMVLDLEYIENWNLGLDLDILRRTISVVLDGGGR
ncbi:MAG: sugar transferase [Candidatus Acidiferrum sp.]|jgi:exopolysaccharide biosynthesis polyprenyl glycosylphosphotransferase